MSAQLPLYQTILDRISAAVPPSIRRSAITRLALLTTGILAAKSTVLAQIAAELYTLDLTDAACPEHIERGLRRTLNDPLLQAHTCYLPVLSTVLDWDQLLRGSRQVVLSVDDSTKTDQIHLFRVSLSYWGGALPLAWAVWEQNVKQPPGHYFQQVDAVFDQVSMLLPAGLRVVVVADRAFAVPNFIDRCAQRGWHWVVRLTTSGSHRVRDVRGRERSLRDLLGQQLQQPGQRWKTRGWVFKDAGWRQASLVGVWGSGAQESLVVLSDQAAQWEVLATYARRFWCEPGFRTDKSKGWQWEQSQVQGVAHHAVLLLGMAWASLVAVCAGLHAAEERLAREDARRARGCRGQPRPARESVFTVGLRAVRRWLYGTARTALPWRVSGLDGPSWERRWHACQANWLIFSAAGP